MKIKNLLFILLVSLITSCANPHKKTKLHCYQTQTNNVDVLFWYVWVGSDNTYYSYSSPSSVTNFTDIAWVRTNGIPSELSNEKELPEQELNENELSEELQAELEASPEAEIDAGVNDTGVDSEASTDAGSNDSGTDGGGDGGGGD